MSTVVDYKADVTVVIPTFNRAKELERAIRSALTQSYRNLTVLVMDDQSTDATESVVREISKNDKRVLYHRQPVNVGVSRNWLAGLRMVDTEFVCLLMDDDYYEPDFMKSRVKGLRENPHCAFTFSPFQKVDERGAVLGLSRSFPGAESEVIPYEKVLTVTTTGGTHIGTMVFRTSELSLIWDQAESYSYAVDSALLTWLVLRRKTPGLFLKQANLRVSVHENQIYERHTSEVYRLASKLYYTAFADPRLVESRPTIRKIYSALLDDWARYEAPRNPLSSFKHLLYSSWYEPLAMNRWRQRCYTIALALKLKKPATR